jgi:hypothetical protein
MIVVAVTARALAAQDSAPAAENSLRETLGRAIQNATGQQLYELTYKFTEGDQFRWNVEHVQTTKTSINEYTEIASSRTESITSWRVISVDSQRRASLVQTIEAVKFWQRIGEAEPVAFDSRGGTQPPSEFENEAKRVGLPFPAIVVLSDGQVSKNDDANSRYDFGAGSFWIPLPSHPVPVGQTWTVPNTLIARDDDGSYKRIKVQIEYELQSVAEQTATIRFDTQVLTPIDSPSIQSQICQQMTHGQVEFDLAAGLITRKKVNWNEKVVSFNTANSLTHYLGEYTISIIRPDAAPVRRAAPVIARPLQIRTREEPPVFRR